MDRFGCIWWNESCPSVGLWTCVVVGCLCISYSVFPKWASSSPVIDPLRRVFNDAVRFVAGLGPRDHATENLTELHWLPIRQRISFKLCLMMHAAVTGLYHITPLSTLPGRNRHHAAATGECDVPRTRTGFRGKGAFSVAGSREWNSLTPDVSNVDNREVFKRALRIYNCKQVYDCQILSEIVLL